ncbi:MAG: DUF3795 domain-containing protein [Candidatus Cloacimonadaceae bacterium]|nr:DUF3795 domain-containing protein [Candidatus Cloacimonadaceae bacterium]
MISKCGVICASDCRAYSTECDGCNELDGQVSWAEFYGLNTCPIYACVLQKGLSTCADCGQAPCQIWYDTRNPDASDQEFMADIRSRLANLHKLI